MTRAIIELGQPAWLALCVLAAIPPLAAWRGRRHGRAVPWLVVALQTLAIFLTAAALARPTVPLGNWHDRPVMVLQDVSGSVRGQDVSLPIPAGRPVERFDFSSAVAPAGQPMSADATNLSPALQLAAGRADDLSAVVIHTDGRFTDADWPASAEALGRAGADVLIVPMDAARPDARVTQLDVARDGPIIRVTVSVAANATQRRTLTVTHEGVAIPLLQKPLNLMAGDAATFVLTDSYARNAEGATYHARLDTADAYPENDVLVTQLSPREPRIALVGCGEEQVVPFGVAIVPADAPLRADGWANFSAVILMDATGTLLDASQRAALAEYVRTGGGLLLIGAGPHASPADRDDPLNRVAALVADPYERRPLAVTVVLDASGSMAQTLDIGEGGTAVKFNLARDAVLNLRRHLTVADSLRVIVFSDKARRIYAADGGAVNFSELRDALDAVRPAGPTHVEPALAMALSAPSEKGRRPFVLLVSDLATEAFDPAAMARRFRAAGATLAVVAPRGDNTPDNPPLAALAKALDAPLSRPENLTDLTNVFSRLLRSARPPDVVRGEFAARWPVNPFGVNVSALPPLGAYIPSSPVASAEVLGYVSADALLARRRAGLGRSVTLAVPLDDPKNADWQRATATWRLLTAAMRWVARSPNDPRFFGRAVREGRWWRIEVHAEDADGPINLLTLTAETLSGATPMAQVAPGVYTAQLPADAAKILQVRDAAGRVVWWRVLPQTYPAEFSAVGADWDALRRLAARTGGRIVYPAELTTAIQQRRGRASLPLWPWMLAAALACMLVEWVVRRVVS